MAIPLVIIADLILSLSGSIVNIEKNEKSIIKDVDELNFMC